MSALQIKIWYGILCMELFLLGVIFGGISIWAETLGIDSGGSWGTGRVFIAGLGAAFLMIASLLTLPKIRKIVQADKIANLNRYFVQSLLWILVVLVSFEMIVEVVFLYEPGKVVEKGWGMVAVPGSIRIWGKEGYGITHYLEHGEIATPYDDGVSVVVLGDSHTEAFQVSDEFKYVSVAETIIRSGGKLFNLHNLGKSGNGVANYIYLAPFIKQYYRPEVVVIQLGPGDFWGAAGGDSFNSTAHDSFFVINASGGMELIHKNSNEPSLWEKYVKFACKFTMVSYGLEKYYQILQTSTETKSVTDQLQPTKFSILPVARLDDQLKLLREAYSGTKIILLSIPYSPNISKNSLNFTDTENPKIIASAKDAGGFIVINPQDEFDHLPAMGHFPRGFISSLPGVGHLNIFGHRIIGELLAEKILEITK